MLLRLALLMAFLVAPEAVPAQAQTAGDIAIVGFRADNPDEFAFVALAPIAGGTEIAFTDNGWQASGSFRANEGTFRYIAPAGGLNPGTVVVVTEPPGPAFSASGDQLLAYIGSDDAPTFLYALNVEGNAEWQTDAISSNTSALPAGLANGSTAVAVQELDNVAYTGPTSGSRSELLSAIGDPANWTGSDDTRPPFPTSFTVSGDGGNLPPSFTAVLPDRDVFVDVPVMFDYEATDPEGEPVTFALAAGPTGATVDAASGVFAWTPPVTLVDQAVEIRVSASDGEDTVTSTATLTVRAEAPDQAPVFSEPTYAVLTDESSKVVVTYDAIDPEGGTVTYMLTASPDGVLASVGRTTGVFKWVVSAPPGVYPFAVSATDSEGSTTQTDLFVGVQGTLFPGLDSDALRDAIQTGYSGTTLGYTDGRDTLYARVSGYPDGVVRGVYTGFEVALDPAQDPSTFLFNRGINAEHTWPQSMGAADEPQRSDMHILYPAKSNVNSSRGNDPYGDVPDAQTQTWYRLAESQAGIPALDIDEWSERGPTVFEPREAVKGDVARASLYFATMYEAAANPAFFDTQRETLVAWDAMDPVAPEEVLRSGLIARYQSNVNPFVLDPTLAQRLTGIAVATEGDPEGRLAVHVYPNPVVSRLTVSVALPAPADVRTEVFDTLGRRVSERTTTLPAERSELALDVSSLPPGVYVVRVEAGGEATARRITVVR